jgi:hypothetical protein
MADVLDAKKPRSIPFASFTSETHCLLRGTDWVVKPTSEGVIPPTSHHPSFTSHLISSLPLLGRAFRCLAKFRPGNYSVSQCSIPWSRATVFLCVLEVVVVVADLDCCPHGADRCVDCPTGRVVPNTDMKRCWSLPDWHLNDLPEDCGGGRPFHSWQGKDISLSRPDRHWGPPSFLYDGFETLWGPLNLVYEGYERLWGPCDFL